MHVHKGRNLMQQKEPQQINDSEEEVEFQCMETKDEEIPDVFPLYMPPRKPNTKPVKEPKEGKTATYTPLLSEEVSFKGEVLGNIP